MICAEAVPSIKALSIARPDTPKTSLTTLASLMLAVSRSFRSRFRSAAWLSTSFRGERKGSRNPRGGGGGRHEALRDQAMPDQIGNPFGVLHIGLAARHVADVPGVADDELKTPFKHGIDGLPV